MTISDNLLDAMVAALATLPYQDVQPIFQQMAIELSKETEEEPKIVLSH